MILSVEDPRPVSSSELAEPLAQPPSAETLRALALGAYAVEWSKPNRKAARAHVRWGLEPTRSVATQWDAAHLMEALRDPRLLDAAFDCWDTDPDTTVRARLCDALVACVGEHPEDRSDVRETLQGAHEDDKAWVVRRVAGDALTALSGRPTHPPAHFTRFQRLHRTGAVDLEAELKPDDLSDLGVRVPDALRVFWAEVCAGGTLQVHRPGGEPFAATFHTPRVVRDAIEQAADTDDVADLHEYVWAKYVEEERQTTDEDAALARYAARYAGGAWDAEAWSYGVLLYETAFEVEGQDQARRLLRARDVLRTHQRVTGEDWDVVDARLSEIEAILAEEGWNWASCAEPGPHLEIGTLEHRWTVWIEQERPGVFLAGESGEVQIAPSLEAYLDDPIAARDRAAAQTGRAEGRGGALGLLEQAAEHARAGRLKRAGRALGDALEEDTSAVCRQAVPAVLEEPLTAQQAVQVLAAIPMVGDKTTATVLRTALQAVSAEWAEAIVEAAAGQDEDGSTIAQVVDAAASVRRKSHTAARDLARRLKADRKSIQTRTQRNPWYKK